MADTVAKINGAINGVVWGVPALILLMGAGIFLTIGLKGFQFRKFGFAMKNTIGKMFSKQEAKEGEVTPFQALTTALAATVGTGNIAGITTAVTLGGAGSIFWLWVSALLGMATKYSEVLLSVKFREQNKKGDLVGGPMYYIKNGLGNNWKWLGTIFCIFGGLASFGIGNAVQIGNITDSVNTAIQAFVPAAAEYRFTINVVLAVILMIIVGIVLIGGIKRIGAVTERLVPVMSVIYIVACLVVVFANIGKLPHVIGMIFQGAFTPAAVTGGAAGIGMKLCITWGVKRGVFSNEAGLGSAPMAHAASSERNPVRQGLYGICEVFMDTIVICTLSGLTILLALDEATLNYGTQGSTALNAQALGTVLGPQVGALIIAIGLSLFALSTVLSWGLYGCRCWEFILGEKSIKPYQIIFTLVIIVSATMDLSLAWDIADTLNGLMAIPNLIGLLLLSPVVFRLTTEFFATGKSTKGVKLKK
ncbi:MAG: sodium:alanine symporter family protein [Oscillospiraceae bacterium]|nr:sodium:alanine symporter family protein [Oscillospiraceae bacterium]